MPIFFRQAYEAVCDGKLPSGLTSAHFADWKRLAGTPPPAPEPQALKEEFRSERAAAFRQTVLKIYDFTCSACGMRVKIDDIVLVDAAHIIPFEESQNDRPDNGLALCPNHHRAMDRFLIAPCPDKDQEAGVWKIARRLEPRIAGHRDLAALANQPLSRPAKKSSTRTQRAWSGAKNASTPNTDPENGHRNSETRPAAETPCLR